jgi:hypothetical protein
VLWRLFRTYPLGRWPAGVPAGRCRRSDTGPDAVQDRADLSVRDRANEPELRVEVAGVLADFAQLVGDVILEGRDDRSVRGYGAE